MEYKALKAKRMAAAIEEDDDLLTDSALVIAHLLAQYPRRRTHREGGLPSGSGNPGQG